MYLLSSSIFLWKNVGPKPFYWIKTTCFDFFFIQFSFDGPHTKHHWNPFIGHFFSHDVIPMWPYLTLWGLTPHLIYLLTLWYIVTKKGSGHEILDNEHKIKMYNHLSQNIFILFDNIHSPNVTTTNYKYQLPII